MILLTTPKRLLRLEGAALFLAATLLYGLLGAGWPLYALLLLAPDLFALGYLRDPRTGAALYNLGHNLLWPLALVSIGLAAGGLPLALGLIWLAHIGLDRALGYGFKYPDRFGHTHLADRESGLRGARASGG